jgi:hypothetical protein
MKLCGWARVNMTIDAIYKFLGSRTGRVISWLGVLSIGIIAVNSTIYLTYALWHQTVVIEDVIVLAVGLFAARASWVMYKTLVRPFRAGNAPNA